MVDTLSKNHINSILKNHNSYNYTKDHVNEPNLTLESERLKTFKNWNSPIPPEDLVKEGLYYFDNKTKCAFCDVEINLNTLGENVLEDHLRLSPNCPFAESKKGLSTFLKKLPADQDVCGNVDTFTDSFFKKHKLVLPYDNLETRLKSFETWPESCKQKPEDLAAAGFYYKGCDDKTVCFHCSGPLNNWEDDDDPWEQHALWFPKCKFLLHEKGEDFVKEVQKKLKICVDNEDDKCIDDDKMCVICCNNQREVVFVPCGHDWTCSRCLRSLEDTKCPICREQIVRVKNL